MRSIVAIIFIFVFFSVSVSLAQVDTSFIYKTGTPFGTLDLRLAKSATQYYHLEEGKTKSYRESSPGIRTDSYLPLVSWNSSDYTQGNLREKIGSLDNLVMNYRLLFPENYDASYSPGYPLIIMLHGLGERANCWDNKCYHGGRDWNYNSNTPPAPTDPNHLLLNNELPLNNGGAVHRAARNLAGSMLPDDPAMPARAFPGFVLFPQNLNGWSSSSVQDAIRIIRLLIKKHNIDENRIIVEGISNGGGGAFEALKRAPWLFSSALMMSPISDAFVVSQGQAPNIAHVPIWIFQGGKDTGPSPSLTERTIKSLRDAGTVVRYSLYPNLGHGTWNTAFKEPDFFSWMLSNNKTKIHNYAGNSAICLTTNGGVKLEVSSGFFKYQWKKDGEIISDATSSVYLANTPGIYSARFSRFQNPTEEQWNPWSDGVTITQQIPAQATLEQKGTIILPDLNGAGSAFLNSKDSYPHYYWYKDGSLINFTGEQDDTIKYAEIKPIVGSGIYTLVTAGFENCPSPPSISKHIYFNNEAPVVITAPSDFKANLLSNGNVNLTWNDNANNENGFELWRRKVISESTYTPWELRKLTSSNVTSYTDAGLESLTTYQYKIRGVADIGRSDYTPAAADQYLVVRTVVDEIDPLAPFNLKAARSGFNNIVLTWQSPSENIDVKQYKIYYDSLSVDTSSPQLSYVFNNLPINSTYNFTVRAEDLNGNLSTESNIASADTYLEGLYYEHSTGAWVSLDSIDWSLAEFTGTINTFSLSPKTQDDYFNFKFDGYLNISKGGTYNFSTISNDGSRLMLDSVVIVNNDGVHENNVEVISSDQTLTAGPKRITVTYFEYIGAESLTVRYKGPDTNDIWMDLPDSALYSGKKPESTNQPPLILSIYPNPSQTNNINLRAETDRNEPMHVTIINTIGELVYEQNFNSNELQQGITLTPKTQLNDGLYILTVSQNKRSSQFKMVIRN